MNGASFSGMRYSLEQQPLDFEMAQVYGNTYWPLTSLLTLRKH